MPSTLPMSSGLLASKNRSGNGKLNTHSEMTEELEQRLRNVNSEVAELLEIFAATGRDTSGPRETYCSLRLTKAIIRR